jgi:hypothetical protein
VIRKMMMHLRRSIVTTLVLFAALVVASSASLAATVSLDASSPEVFVDDPFTVSLTIEFEDSYEPARLPGVPGLDVVDRSSPMTSSQVTVINGRTTRSQSVRWDFILIAQRTGTFTIPSFTVIADGEKLRTQPLRIIASETETTEKLFTNVISERSKYYLGERIDLTLEVWLRPFRSRSLDMTFSYEQMWRCIDQRSSRFGVFRGDDNSIKARQATRRDESGVERAYYVFMIERTISPVRAGPIPLDEIVIYADYPESLRQGRGFFGDRRLEIDETTRLSARLDHDPIEVVEPPSQRRPAMFNGAVGRFDFDVTAEPTSVLAGDPITLTMTITDRTNGSVQLELLPAPPLEQLPELVDRFRMPSDPLAGVVGGETKTFTQTIRPRSSDVHRIPPIPLVFFDPREERYVTVRSEPISIDVGAVESVSVGDVVGGVADRSAAPTELTEVAGGILANYSGPDLLVAQRPMRLAWWHLVLVLLPAVAFAVTAVSQRRLRRLRSDHGYARRRTARRRAEQRLDDARNDPEPGAAHAIALALSDYVADRCNLPAGTLTRVEVTAHLTASGVPQHLVDDVGDILAECEQLRYGGAAGQTDALQRRAAATIRGLERERLG